MSQLCHVEVQTSVDFALSRSFSHQSTGKIPHVRVRSTPWSELAYNPSTLCDVRDVLESSYTTSDFKPGMFYPFGTLLLHGEPTVFIVREKAVNLTAIAGMHGNFMSKDFIISKIGIIRLIFWGNNLAISQAPSLLRCETDCKFFIK